MALSTQVLAYASTSLRNAGALDVWTTPCMMKKGRAGTVLHVLCHPPLRDICVAIILQETSSLGVRVLPVQRASLPRRIVSVKVEVPCSDGSDMMVRCLFFCVCVCAWVA